MDSRIRFGTKHELNKLREKEFLALSGVQRIAYFIEAMKQHNILFGMAKKDPNKFFILTKNFEE